MKTRKSIGFAARVFLAGLMTTFALTSAAQNNAGALREVLRDTTYYDAPTTIHVERDSLFDPMRVVTNRFSKDWFLYGDVGVHTFRGDYSNLGKFSGTLSPDFEVGFGKWFTPGIALRVGAMYSNTRGYFSEYLHNNPAAEDYSYNAIKANWFDFNAGALLNLSRLFVGYEGYGSRRLMNQFLLYAGIGIVHHTGYGGGYGSNNELNARLEFQYSRFFSPKKRASLDLKVRSIFYETNHDGEWGQANYAANKIDLNVGVSLGFTVYLGKGWSQSTTKIYQRDYREQRVMVVQEREVEEPKIEYGTMTFYVFYPNNYSGRDDAPLVAGATVNALDYLAGGIFTQKRYVNTSAVTSRLAQGDSPNRLATENIPTEPADREFEINYVPRGYEMSDSAPMSLSLLPEDMTAFRERAGFYYAPIFDGQHVWMYRIDNAALGQQLLNSMNYTETESFGLNAHGGLEIVRSHMDIDDDDTLVSFADVYAAMTSDNGYIAKYADSETVGYVKRVLENGVITMIQAEGLATSQDNYSGADAERIGAERNTALSQNRANTVITWLKENERLSNAASQIYLVSSLGGPVRKVDDTSTRGLNAKLNRCVKVRVHYMMK
ncbi:MAG: hypothetical protein J1F10_05145 [Muribaculaceae bacterium]|nr:hypothetical protein [Muribaculaceae bacterium]